MHNGQDFSDSYVYWRPKLGSYWYWRIFGQEFEYNQLDIWQMDNS